MAEYYAYYAVNAARITRVRNITEGNTEVEVRVAEDRKAEMLCFSCAVQAIKDDLIPHLVLTARPSLRCDRCRAYLGYPVVERREVCDGKAE